MTFAELIDDGVLDVTDGYRAKNSELGGTGLIFLRAGHVTDTHIDFSGADRFRDELTPRIKEKVSKTGDVAVTTKGNSTGRTTYVTSAMPPFVYSPHLSRWRSLDRDQLEPGFLRYWSNSREFHVQLQGMAASTDMALYLSLRDQRRLAITLPPIGEQRAIANVLGALDDKIEQNRRTAQALERLARAIFRAWFVDFEPIKAKAAGATAFPSVPQHVFDALPTTFTNSDIGPVPEGWEVKPLSDVCTLVSGGTPKRSETTYWGGDIPWYSVKDAPADGEVWVIGTSERISEAGVTNSAAKVVPKGCTIISARGTVGKLAIAGVPMAFNQSCYGLLPDDGQSFDYLHLLMQTVVAELQQRTHGSVFDTITRATFDGLRAPSPRNDFVLAFEAIVSPLFELLLALRHESSKLAEIRDYLLPNLLCGQLRVELAKADVQGVV